jgi:hypothetical protein
MNNVTSNADAIVYDAFLLNPFPAFVHAVNFINYDTSRSNSPRSSSNI